MPITVTVMGEEVTIPDHGVPRVALTAAAKGITHSWPPMAHPAWSFGTVIENQLDGKRAMVVAQQADPAEDVLTILLDTGVRLWVTPAGLPSWQVVPEPPER